MLTALNSFQHDTKGTDVTQELRCTCNEEKLNKQFPSPNPLPKGPKGEGRTLGFSGKVPPFNEFLQIGGSCSLSLRAFGRG